MLAAADPRAIRIAVCAGIAYFILAAGAVLLTRLSDGIALMWVANGALLAALGMTRPKRWPVIAASCFVACLIATVLLRQSWIAGVGFSVANIAEGLIGMTLLRRWRAHRRMFDRPRSVMLFALAAAVVAPAISGVIGAVAAWAAFGLPLEATWFDWLVGHGLGTLIAGPVAVLATVPALRAGWRDARAPDVAIFAGLLLLVAVTTALVFAQSRFPLLFLPALPVMLATFRLGRSGAAASLVILALIGGILTAHGLGPVSLVRASAALRLQFFQFYLGTVFLMALPTAALLTRQRRLLARLQENEAALRLLADHSSDVLLSLDVDGGIRFASPSVRALGGYDPEALIGRNAVELIEPEHRSLVKRAHLDALARPETNVTVEYQARRENGEVAWYETNTRAVRDHTGAVTGVVSAIRDVTHRKSVERQLRLAADTDPLTGLANRRPFVVALDRAIAAHARGTPAVLAMIDIDHFKRVNDRHGHAAGDAALVQLAKLCRRELRGADIIARLGGEEFAVLLGGSDMAGAEAICERLRRAIEQQPIIATAAPLFKVTASFGLAEIASGHDGESLLAAADRALYAAKDGGRNQLKIAA